MEDKQKPAEKVLPVKRKVRKEVAPADLVVAEEVRDQQQPMVNADPEVIADCVIKDNTTGRVPTSGNRR